jgi:ribonuclease HI
MPLPEVHAATDGACRGNPGPGGWAAILSAGAHEKQLTGAERQTTNNRMELSAALAVLEALKGPSRVTIETDSRYLVDGMMTWRHGWKRNGWRTADRKPVKNADLWMALDRAAAPHDIRWIWVKGHAGHPLNERADALANQALDALLGKEAR